MLARIIDSDAGRPDVDRSPDAPGPRRARSVVAWVLGSAVVAVGAFGYAATPLEGRNPGGLFDRGAASVEMEGHALEALARASTVRVAARGCGVTVTGSGFRVDDVLITNRHLVEAADRVKVDQPTAPVTVDVLRRSSEADLAALAPVAAVPLQLADTDAVRGDEVVFAGHAAGGETVVKRATVHLLADGAAYGMQGSVLLLDASSMAGFSGGPVLDGHGRLVGVLQGYEPNLRLTLAIPVSALHSWLGNADVGGHLGGQQAERGSCR